jgi:hypothetical protein
VFTVCCDGWARKLSPGLPKNKHFALKLKGLEMGCVPVQTFGAYSFGARCFRANTVGGISKDFNPGNRHPELTGQQI